MGVGDFQLKFPNKEDSYTPHRPIRLIGGNGASVSILHIEGVTSWRNVMIVGLLVDPEDLYAAKVPSRLDNPTSSGSMFFADLNVASPRPTRIQIEGTSDLRKTIPIPPTAVSRTTNPKQHKVRLNKNQQEQGFIRAKVTTRETE